MQPQLSIVLPCLNEALTLGKCIDQAKQALVDGNLSGEIIVADNGSTDGSREIAIAHGARLIFTGAAPATRKTLAPAAA